MSIDEIGLHQLGRSDRWPGRSEIETGLPTAKLALLVSEGNEMKETDFPFLVPIDFYFFQNTFLTNFFKSVEER